MPRAREALSAGEWAVLALLSEEPAHGFALARAMAPEGEVGQVWAMRRPLVYRALETLEQLGLIRPAGTVPSQSGPQRTILEVTPAGTQAVTGWLAEPVSHVRDARSLLMLKLLFLARSGADPAPLLTAQREQFSAHAERLAAAVERDRRVRPRVAAMAPSHHDGRGSVHRDHALGPNDATPWPTTRSTSSET